MLGTFLGVRGPYYGPIVRTEFHSSKKGALGEYSLGFHRRRFEFAKDGKMLQPHLRNHSDKTEQVRWLDSFLCLAIVIFAASVGLICEGREGGSKF